MKCMWSAAWFGSGERCETVYGRFPVCRALGVFAIIHGGRYWKRAGRCGVYHGPTLWGDNHLSTAQGHPISGMWNVEREVLRDENCRIPLTRLGLLVGRGTS